MVIIFLNFFSIIYILIKYKKHEYKKIYKYIIIYFISFNIINLNGS